MTETEPLLALCRDNGVFLRREALALGYDEKTITRLARSGALTRVRHGAYTIPGLWPDTPEANHRLRARAIMRSTRDDNVLSHISALLEHGADVWGIPLSEVHATRRRGPAGRREAGVRWHQGTLLDDDLTEANGLTVTSPARAAVELTTIVGVEPALAAVNSLLHKKVLTLDAFRGRIEEAERWPNTLATRLVATLADPLVESVGESRTFFMCWSQGLPMPIPQVDVHDEWGGFLGRVDFAWPEHGVFLEFDGLAKYMKYVPPGATASDVVVNEKRREERICEVMGWRCIRITWADLADPARLAARIRRVLERARHAA